MVIEEIVKISEAEYTDKGVKIAKCAAILSLVTMLQGADVVKITKIAEVLTSLPAAELEVSSVIEAFGPLAATPDRGGNLGIPCSHTVPGLTDRRDHNLIRLGAIWMLSSPRMQPEAYPKLSCCLRMKAKI